MKTVLPQEVRRDRLRGAVNRIVADALDRSWRGGAAEQETVREFGALSRSCGDVAAWADAAWLLSVLLERSGDLTGAERELAAVQSNQDIARRRAAALGPRGRITGKYRFLPARLASLRYRLGVGVAEVFDAVEWAKSRALSDAAGESEVPDFERLRRGLMCEGLHYLTFLVDEAESFAVLVTKDGTAVARPEAVGYAQMKGYATPEKISPAGQAGKSANPLLPPGDWTERLGALTGLVDEALAARRMAEGDTMLISPHGVLHLFPVHALRLASAGGRAIGEVMATVRVHGAGTVIRSMAAGAPGRPSGAVVLRAPTREELDDPPYAAAFARCAAVLERRVGTDVVRLDGEAATAAAMLAAFGPDRVLHFSCHGDMLSSGRGDMRSFLLLAQAGRLAERRAFAGRVPEGALTAAAVLARAEEFAADGGWPLRGTHVTLQACVSGHASANPQGDAVGLEWAFLMAGAASTMGTHWHVERDDAAAFTEAFYDSWLGGSSRAAAWARAGAALRRAHGDGRWAAFSLTGEWR